MLPTPSTSHVPYDNVYEPAEDSFLFLDTLASKNETEFLSPRFSESCPAPLFVEVGTGSGVVLAFATAHARHIFGHGSVLSLAVDLNPRACKAAMITVEKARKEFALDGISAGVFAGAMQADLMSSLRTGTVDVLMFNPPYVPSEDSPCDLKAGLEDADAEPMQPSAKFDRDSKLLALATNGGLDGMETTNKFLDDLPRVLNPSRGVAYLLLCAQNRPNQVAEKIKSWGDGWNVHFAGHSGKKAGWEVLHILRIWRTPTPC